MCCAHGREPYWCLLFKMCSAYTDLGLLVSIYPQCSLYLVFRFHSVCPIYAFPQVWPVSLHIPNFSDSFSMWFRSFIRCDTAFVGWNAICIGVPLNKQLSPIQDRPAAPEASLQETHNNITET